MLHAGGIIEYAQTIYHTAVLPHFQSFLPCSGFLFVTISYYLHQGSVVSTLAIKTLPLAPEMWLSIIASVYEGKER